jgi:hypothetical protein
MLALASQQLNVPAAEQPQFDVPRHFLCRGVNVSGQKVAVDVALAGGARDTQFIFTPVDGSAWPSKRIEAGPISSSFFGSDDTEFWYWTSVGLNLDGQGYNFGFDLKFKGSKPGALRFSREKYAPNLRTGEVKADPKGAYLDDVPCAPSQQPSEKTQ